MITLEGKEFRDFVVQFNKFDLMQRLEETISCCQSVEYFESTYELSS